MSVMEAITVEQVGNKFFARCTFEQKDIVKAAGFRWNPQVKKWYTDDPAVAAKFANAGAQQLFLQEIEQRKAERAVAVEQSRAAAPVEVVEVVDVPAPAGLKYLPYQLAGIMYALAHACVLFGDEMGLGKTIQAIGTINADATIRRILVICPASLKLNWMRELKRWLVRQFTIQIAQGSWCHPEATDITIINYDIVSKHIDAINRTEWDMVIIDEMHYLKNPKAQRTQAVLGVESKKDKAAKPGITARRRIGLTGTPIPNRPVEGYPIFHYLAPAEFPKFWGYAMRYCDGRQNGYGWDFTGASNLPELQEKLRASCMIRRLKKDVLTELPAKRRAVIELACDSGAVARETEAWEAQQEMLANLRAAVELAKASDNPNDYRTAVDALKEALQVAFTEMARMRHDTAVEKIPYVIEHLKNVTEEGHKVVVFAHHHDVIKAIAAEFGHSAVTVFGETSMSARQAAVDRFQKEPECLLFIGGIQAAGVGLTLTAASHVVFAELDWVPGNVSQAEDRCHRIGQRDMVLVEHLVLEGSLDARMARILVEKQEVIDSALDKEIPPPVAPVKADERAASEGTTLAQLEREAHTMTPEEISNILAGLRQLVALDSDRALQRNGVGFNQADTFIGHRLAAMDYLTPKQAALGAKLVNKYRRQLVSA
jgi:SNF2 family DNA or RNA helicase